MKTLIISAFPGCGKSHCVKHEQDKFKEMIVDLESSDYSWRKDENGARERNPEFPKNYIEKIKEGIGTANIIFVSSHKEVRDALKEAGLKYILVYPNHYQKEEYLKRYEKRGNSPKFINQIDYNWEEWIDECDNETFPIKIKLPYFSLKYLNKEVIDLISIMEDLNYED